MGTDKSELMVSIFDKVQKGCMAFQLDLTYFRVEHFFEIWYTCWEIYEFEIERQWKVFAKKFKPLEKKSLEGDSIKKK